MNPREQGEHDYLALSHERTALQDKINRGEVPERDLKKAQIRLNRMNRLLGEYERLRTKIAVQTR